jgi:hypothetical protein
MAKTVPADVSVANIDETGDDPKQARSDIKDLFDKFNALKASFDTLALMSLGTGFSVTANPAGTRDVLNVAAGSAAWSAGDAKLTIKNTPDTGWVIANDGTIGSASSGATNRANADTADLYTLLWNNVANTWAPVTGGRGASAAADFAANKAIKLGSVLGRALAIAGAGSGLTSRALGQFLGEEAHALTGAENGPHVHGNGTLAAAAHSHNLSADSQPSNNSDPSGRKLAAPGTADIYRTSPANPVTMHSGSIESGGGGALGGAMASSGDGDAHNTMQPTAFLFNVLLKL